MKRTTITRYVTLGITLLSIMGMCMTVSAISGNAQEELTSTMNIKLTNELSVANEYLTTLSEENEDSIATPMLELFINLQDEEFINDITSDEETQNLLDQIQTVLDEYEIK